MRTFGPVLLAVALALSMSACGGAESGKAPAPLTAKLAVPTSDLPRTGMVWEPPADPLEIALAADGTITFLGREVGLEELRIGLIEASREPRLRAADGTSKLDVVLRVAPAVPWTFVIWAYVTCSDPNAEIVRLYVAVVPEAGGPEGVIPTFLPRSGSHFGSSSRVGRPVASYLFAADGTADRGAIFAALKASLAATTNKAVEIDAPMPRLPRAGHVVSVLDLSLRAGAERIDFVGAPPPVPRRRFFGGTSDVDRAGEPGSAAWLRAWVAEYVRNVPAGLRVKVVGAATIDGSTASAALPPPPPRRPRSVDGGYTDAPRGDHDIPEEPPYVPDETETTPGERASSSPNGAPESSPSGGPTSAGGGRPAVFPGRSRRLALAADRESAPATDRSIDAALAWLAAHQSPDGSWEAEGFGRWCDGKPSEGDAADGKGSSAYDVGTTGLALLAFLGSGYTNRSDAPYGRVVANGLKFLRTVQDDDGCFGPRASPRYVYGHAIASLALIEAFGMTGSSIYKRPAQKGLDFIGLARNPGAAWRYGVKPGDDDTSITGWMTLALSEARWINANDTNAGRPPSLAFDAEAFDGARAWIDKMTDPRDGRVGYQVRGSGAARPAALVDVFPATRSESMTAIGVLLRLLLGEDPATSDLSKKGVARMAALPPVWNPNDGSIDLYYWQMAALALDLVGGASTDAWRAALVKALTEHQRLDGEPCGVRGSWDPIDPWGSEGGRVYATAMAALALEAPDRFRRVGMAR